jgi:hypothetical protein
LELCAGLDGDAHELCLVEDPESVIVEQAEVSGPSGAAGGVAAVEGAGDELVLGADQDGGLFGSVNPGVVNVASHQDVDGGEGGATEGGACALNPVAHALGDLLRKDAHRQAIDEALRGLGGGDEAAPQPRDHDRSRLAKPCWDVKEIGPLSRLGVSSERGLVREWFYCVCAWLLIARAEEVGIGRHAMLHRMPDHKAKQGKDLRREEGSAARRAEA